MQLHEMQLSLTTHFNKACLLENTFGASTKTAQSSFVFENNSENQDADI
jgi:hypothetical protein